MSARERFFKKIKQNTTPPHNTGSVEADIRVFCRQMDALARQITQWLDGTGTEIIPGLKSLSDLSTVGASLNSGASRYEITTIRVQNGLRSVSIIPEQLYQSGEKGCVRMVLDLPDTVPDRQIFYLSLAPEGGWYIRGEYQDVRSRVLLTEESFFRAIDSLA